MDKNRKKLENLYDIGLAFASLNNLEDLLQIVVSKLSNLMDADRSTVFFFDKDSNTLWSKAAQGLEVIEIRLELGKGIAGAAALSKEPLLIEDAYSDSRFNPEVDKSSGYRTRNILCLPFFSTKDNSLLGVTQVLNKNDGDFSSDDISTLKLINAQISISVENTLLFNSINARNKVLVATQNELKHSLDQLELFYFIEKLHVLHLDEQKFKSKEFLKKLALSFDLSQLILEIKDPLVAKYINDEEVLLRKRLKADEVFEYKTTFYRDKKAIGSLLLRKYSEQGFNIDTDGLERVVNHFKNAVEKFNNDLKQKERDRLYQLGETLSKLIHDISSPIGIIRGYNELIKLEAKDSNILEYNNTIDRQIEYIKGMTREVLMFARGESQLLRVPVNMNTFFKNLAVDFSEYKLFRDIELEYDIQYKGKLNIDEIKIKSCILNLLKNSAEAITENGHIRLSCIEEGNCALISVEDNGPGISEELKPFIFDRFVSAEKSNGTGLGLAIVKKIVEDHDATIELSSLEPRGTKFSLRIPLLPIN